MATQQQVVALIEAWRRRDDPRFEQYAKIIAADARRKNPTSTLANDIDRLIGKGRTTLEGPKDPDSGMELGRLREPKTTFQQMSLSPELQATLDQFLAEVDVWDQLETHSVRRRNRALFYGPAGCGKTSLASALAARLGRQLLVVETAAVTSSLLGKTGKNLTRLFDFIGQGSFVVLFDEFDSLGQSRGAEHDVGEIRRSTNILLQKIEDYAGDSIIVAATNFEGLLDGALWRRFDLIAELPLPRHDEIVALLSGLRLDADATAEQAHRLVGLSHAAAAFARDTAWRLALVAGRSAPTVTDMTDAVTATLGRPWSGPQA